MFANQWLFVFRPIFPSQNSLWWVKLNKWAPKRWAGSLISQLQSPLSSIVVSLISASPALMSLNDGEGKIARQDLLCKGWDVIRSHWPGSWCTVKTAWYGNGRRADQGPHLTPEAALSGLKQILIKRLLKKSLPTVSFERAKKNFVWTKEQLLFCTH